jgi:hypothetical protein
MYPPSSLQKDTSGAEGCNQGKSCILYIFPYLYAVCLDPTYRIKPIYDGFDYVYLNRNNKEGGR